MANTRKRSNDQEDQDVRRYRLMPPEQVAKELRKAHIDPRPAIERVKELVSRKLREWNGGHRRGVHEALMACFATLRGLTTILQFAQGTAA
jgi:hypothetical protein